MASDLVPRDASPGSILTVAGGRPFRHPTGVTVEAGGTLLVADTQRDCVRRILADGTVDVVAGSRGRGFAGDGGPATAAQLHAPTMVLWHRGELYIADRNNHAVRRIDTHGVIHTVIGGPPKGRSPDGVPVGEARLDYVRAIRFAPDGGLHFTDRNNHAVRRIDPDGTVRTVVGGSGYGYAGDGGPAVEARLNRPRDLLFDPDGRLFVSDRNNHAVRCVEPDGTIRTVAGGHGPGLVDGRPGVARLNHPTALALDGDGMLFVTEHSNNAVRRIDPDGWVSTVAGGNGAGYSGDGGPARRAQLHWPSGIDVDERGNLVVADRNNDAVRVVVGVAVGGGAARGGQALT